MLSMLYVAKEELPNPLYFDHAKLARIMHTHVPQNKMIRLVFLESRHFHIIFY